MSHLPRPPREHVQVPCQEYPCLSAAVRNSAPGAVIQLAADYTEHLIEPLILDRPITIKGPPLGSALATLVVEEGIIVVGLPSSCPDHPHTRCRCKFNDDIIELHGLILKSTSVPALTLKGACIVEQCNISSPEIGIQVVPHPGGKHTLIRECTIHGCDVGLCFSGDPAECSRLEGNRIEDNFCGISIVGMVLHEGASERLAPFVHNTYASNHICDLQLAALEIQEKTSGVVRQSTKGFEVRLKKWPGANCGAMLATNCGAVMLKFGPTGGVHVSITDVQSTSQLEVERGCGGLSEAVALDLYAQRISEATPASPSVPSLGLEAATCATSAENADEAEFASASEGSLSDTHQ